MTIDRVRRWAALTAAGGLLIYGCAPAPLEEPPYVEVETHVHLDAGE